ncbi:hypothetical protein KR009_000332 [Drosophila setifemur]|nr:hypothetical protein KR009_000332 [Drosophila setifemur]
MFAEAALISNSNEVPVKRSLTGASVNMKKLFKTFKRIFTQSKSGAEKPSAMLYTCLTEEEHDNWLNEQLEAKRSTLLPH